jgi:hypothetical protein
MTWTLLENLRLDNVNIAKDIYNQNGLRGNKNLIVNNFFDPTDVSRTERGIYVVVPSTWYAQFWVARPAYYAVDYELNIYIKSGTTLTLQLTQYWNSFASAYVYFQFNVGTTYVLSIKCGPLITEYNADTINFNTVKRRASTVIHGEVETIVPGRAIFFMRGKAEDVEQKLVEPVIVDNSVDTLDNWIKNVPVYGRVERGYLPPGVVFNPTTLKFTGKWNGELTNVIKDPDTGETYYEALILLAKNAVAYASYYPYYANHINYSTRWVKFKVAAGCAGDPDWDAHKADVLAHLIDNTQEPIIEPEYDPFILANATTCICPAITEFLNRK